MRRHRCRYRFKEIVFGDNINHLCTELAGTQRTQRRGAVLFIMRFLRFALAGRCPWRCGPWCHGNAARRLDIAHVTSSSIDRAFLWCFGQFVSLSLDLLLWRCRGWSAMRGPMCPESLRTHLETPVSNSVDASSGHCPWCSQTCFALLLKLTFVPKEATDRAWWW